jgi:hypothetical protein
VLDKVGVVHMNGRVYDPMLGRFGTPDPMTKRPWQGYTYRRKIKRKSVIRLLGNAPNSAGCWTRTATDEMPLTIL